MYCVLNGHVEGTELLIVVLLYISAAECVVTPVGKSELVMALFK